MSLQDKLERVLREIHIMFAESRQYMDDEDLIIVEKHKIFQLLNQLNVYVYEMMDEHEITEAGRDRFQREVKRSAEKLVAEAQKQAEDVYAASVMYAEEALDHVQEAIEQANLEVETLLQRTKYALSEQKETIQLNQLELTEQLQDMADAKVYFRMIEDRNRQIARKKAEGSKERKQIEEWSWKGKKERAKPEIKINTAYFEKTGMSLREVDGNDEFDEPVREAPQVTVNLDAEYFKWKKEQESGETEQSETDSEESVKDRNKSIKAEEAEDKSKSSEDRKVEDKSKSTDAGNRESQNTENHDRNERILEEINIDDIHIEEINIETLELDDLNLDDPETEKSTGGIAT